jgi:hypothetical protein
MCVVSSPLAENEEKVHRLAISRKASRRLWVKACHLRRPCWRSEQRLTNRQPSCRRAMAAEQISAGKNDRFFSQCQPIAMLMAKSRPRYAACCLCFFRSRLIFENLFSKDVYLRITTRIAHKINRRQTASALPAHMKSLRGAYGNIQR